jgi:DNA-binding NarL/FixJ family response regulator
VHTVNTHRQRILEKLEVNNSIEALYSAKRLGTDRLTGLTDVTFGTFF